MTRTTKQTAILAEIWRRALAKGGFVPTDIETSRSNAVRNVKNTILAKHKLNSVEEWSAAREAHKKGSLRQ
jgi:hypothetical protein